MEHHEATRVLVWGTGAYFHLYFNHLLHMRELGQVELVAITGRDVPEVASIDGIPVLAREEAVALAFDLVVVMSTKYYPQIRDEVTQTWGVCGEKVVSCELLCVPRIDLRRWLELRDSHVSVISNHHWGGLVCDQLQLRRRSPFCDLFVREDDFFRLLSDPRRYVENTPLEFVERRVDTTGRAYPMMRLDDVALHFNNSTTPDEARAAWEQQKASVNWDNVMVALCTTKPAHAEHLEGLVGYDKRVCFVPFECDLAHALRIPQAPGETWFFNTVNGSAAKGTLNYCYDPVELLLGNAHASRIVF